MQWSWWGRDASWSLLRLSLGDRLVDHYVFKMGAHILLIIVYCLYSDERGLRFYPGLWHGVP